LGKRVGLFTNAGGEVAAAGAPQGYGSGAGAKPEQPVCEQAVAFTLGDLDKLELLPLEVEGFHIEVARALNPVFVDFDRQGSDQP
jgi:hypothetical protein